MGLRRRRTLLLILGAGVCAAFVLLLLLDRSGREGAEPAKPPPVPDDRIPAHAEAPPPLDEAAEAPSGESDPVPESPGEKPTPRLELLHVSTDRQVYFPGDPVKVRMVFRNDGPTPVEVAPWEHRGWGDCFVIITASGQSAYVPTRPGERLAVAPGDIYEYVCSVELRDVGPTTIEGPHPPFARPSDRERFRVQFEVADREESEALREKIGRLARRVEEEDDLFAPSIWTQAQQDLQKVGKAAIPRLREMLRDSNRPQARAVAAKLLSRMDGLEAVPDLVAALSDPAAEVRREAVEALGNFRVSETFDAMVPLIDDPEWDVRHSAVSSVARFGLARAVRPLTDALDDEERFVRTTAALALARKGNDTGIEVLMEALRAEPSQYVSLIAETLGSLTGQDFGTAHDPRFMSGFDQMEEAEKQCAEVAKKWLEWWDGGGERKPK